MAYAIANRYLEDHYLAQDVVQEAAFEAFVHHQELKEPAAFPGWFRQIVFRQCTRVMRQASAPSLSLEAGGFDLFAESTPEEIALQGEVQACVRLAVAALPKPEQLVTVLFYGRHYSYTEVSTILKIPLTTVKKRLLTKRVSMLRPGSGGSRRPEAERSKRFTRYHTFCLKPRSESSRQLCRPAITLRRA